MVTFRKELQISHLNLLPAAYVNITYFKVMHVYVFPRLSVHTNICVCLQVSRGAGTLELEL